MKIPHVLPVLAALALAASAPAQQVVFSEGFESGLGAWTATGLWNLVKLTDRMGLVLGLAMGNVTQGTGGPFAAAVFERDSGRRQSGLRVERVGRAGPRSPRARP